MTNCGLDGLNPRNCYIFQSWPGNCYECFKLYSPLQKSNGSMEPREPPLMPALDYVCLCKWRELKRFEFITKCDMGYPSLNVMWKWIHLDQKNFGMWVIHLKGTDIHWRNWNSYQSHCNVAEYECFKDFVDSNIFNSIFVLYCTKFHNY